MTKLIEITGKALSGEWGTEDETGSGIPVLRTTNFTNEGVVDYDNVITRCITKKNIEDKYLRNGDIILEKSGGSDKQPVGRVVFFDGPEKTYLFNNFTGLLRVKNTSNWYPRYVFYSLLSNYLSGGTRKYENKTTGLHNLQADEYVSNFNVKDASLNTQKQICYQLDRVSNIIRQRNDEIASLDTLTKARFVELFGNPDDNPYNWDQVNLEDVCSSIVRGPFGSALKKAFFVPKNEDTYKVYEQKNAIQKNASLGTYYITKDKYNELKRFECKPGDIIMSCSGTMGELYRLPEDCERGIINQALCKFTVNEKMLPEAFIVYMEENIGDLKSQGSAIKNIAAVSFIKKIKINLPPMKVQENFVDFLHQVDKSKAAVQKSLDETQLLFDSLMQKYFG